MSRIDHAQHTAHASASDMERPQEYRHQASDGQVYVFRYRLDYLRPTLMRVGELARDPRVAFTWQDASHVVLALRLQAIRAMEAREAAEREAAKQSTSMRDR